MVHHSVVKGIVRHHLHFRRYIFAIQYHGRYFLGVSRPRKNLRKTKVPPIRNGKDAWTSSSSSEIINDETGIEFLSSTPPSVEECIHGALSKLVGEGNFENFQISSRTDRGVHALWNTFHVDIRQKINSSDNKKSYWDSSNLQHGVNYYLKNEITSHMETDHSFDQSHKSVVSHGHNPSPQKNTDPNKLLVSDKLRVVKVIPAPNSVPNPFRIYHGEQPAHIDWHARYNAIRRTYIYRIIATTSSRRDWGFPFFHEYTWRVILSEHEVNTDPRKRHGNKLLDIEEMKKASQYLVGTHDFTSFRGRLCQRASPVVHLFNIDVRRDPVPPFLSLATHTSFVDDDRGSTNSNHIFHSSDTEDIQFVSIIVEGNAFLYKQVRKIIGCLVEVGKAKLSSTEVKDILNSKDKKLVTFMAPPEGLCLSRVEHEHVSDPSFGISGRFSRYYDKREQHQ